MDAEDFIEAMSQRAYEFVYKMSDATAIQLALDARAFSGRVGVDETAIAVHRDQDRMLQYYGGFEYVDKEYRVEVGDFIFYLAGDSRVQGHLDHFFQREENKS